jgi:hypothetical protein
MPRFFFDLTFDGENSTRDEEGSLLADLTMAQVEATRALADLAKGVIRSGDATNSLAVIVRDSPGGALVISPGTVTGTTEQAASRVRGLPCSGASKHLTVQNAVFQVIGR